MATLSTKPGSSGSEELDNYRYTMVDEKKRKRMISNRESARRSRKKREEHIKDLNDQVIYFGRKKNEIIHKINKVTKLYREIETENIIMRSQEQELMGRLESAETLSNYIQMGAYQDPWLRSQQQQQQQHMPIMSSVGFFEF